MEQLTLWEIIRELTFFDPNEDIVDFEPHSYRWDYSELALEKLDNMTTVWELTRKLLDCVWKTFEWYKWWEYEMNNDTLVWLAPYGEAQETYITWFKLGGNVQVWIWWYIKY